MQLTIFFIYSFYSLLKLQTQYVKPQDYLLGMLWSAILNDLENNVIFIAKALKQFCEVQDEVWIFDVPN